MKRELPLPLFLFLEFLGLDMDLFAGRITVDARRSMMATAPQAFRLHPQWSRSVSVRRHTPVSSPISFSILTAHAAQAQQTQRMFKPLIMSSSEWSSGCQKSAIASRAIYSRYLYTENEYRYTVYPFGPMRWRNYFCISDVGGVCCRSPLSQLHRTANIDSFHHEIKRFPRSL